MKVLVTGASGFVGGHLVRELQLAGHEVVGIGHLPSKDQVDGFQRLDLLSATEVANYNFSGLDSIVHLAGLAAVGPSFAEPLRYISSNAGMQINLCEALIQQNVFPKLLIVSTGSVYNSGQLPIVEETPVGPRNPYAISKYTQELLAPLYREKGLHIMVARPFNHIGPEQSEGFLIADLVQQIVAARRTNQPIIKVGNLTSRRDFTDVRDIARAYSLILEHGHDGETYNVCSGVSHSGQEILDQLILLSGAAIKIQEDATRMRPGDIADIYGSNQKLRRDTGWQPNISLKSTLQDVLADWESRLS